ncbi:MAG TPA: multidrug efflux SMR transporter [Burkholderiaceae bacterium]|jgi:small multidrug resistance pump|nr:multidrug efflux SMR transporter [Burkholderiaceae bacterium]
MQGKRNKRDARAHQMFEVAPGAHDPLAALAAAAGQSIEERLHAPPPKRRRWRAYLWLLAAIVAGVTGTAALSASQGLTRVEALAVMVPAYLTCFIALTRALKTIAVGVAYAIWSGLGIASITLIGWRVFGQRLNAGELAGIALILAGVVVIQLFSRRQAQ